MNRQAVEAPTREAASTAAPPPPPSSLHSVPAETYAAAVSGPYSGGANGGEKRITIMKRDCQVKLNLNVMETLQEENEQMSPPPVSREVPAVETAVVETIVGTITTEEPEEPMEQIVSDNHSVRIAFTPIAPTTTTTTTTTTPIITTASTITTASVTAPTFIPRQVYDGNNWIASQFVYPAPAEANQYSGCCGYNTIGCGGYSVDGSGSLYPAAAAPLPLGMESDSGSSGGDSGVWGCNYYAAAAPSNILVTDEEEGQEKLIPVEACVIFLQDVRSSIHIILQAFKHDGQFQLRDVYLYHNQMLNFPILRVIVGLRATATTTSPQFSLDTAVGDTVLYLARAINVSQNVVFAQYWTNKAEVRWLRDRWFVCAQSMSMASPACDGKVIGERLHQNSKVGSNMPTSLFTRLPRDEPERDDEAERNSDSDFNKIAVVFYTQLLTNDRVSVVLKKFAFKGFKLECLRASYKTKVTLCILSLKDPTTDMPIHPLAAATTVLNALNTEFNITGEAFARAWSYSAGIQFVRSAFMLDSTDLENAPAHSIQIGVTTTTTPLHRYPIRQQQQQQQQPQQQQQQQYWGYVGNNYLPPLPPTPQQQQYVDISAYPQQQQQYYYM